MCGVYGCEEAKFLYNREKQFGGDRVIISWHKNCKSVLCFEIEEFISTGMQSH